MILRWFSDGVAVDFLSLCYGVSCFPMVTCDLYWFCCVSVLVLLWSGVLLMVCYGFWPIFSPSHAPAGPNQSLVTDLNQT